MVRMNLDYLRELHHPPHFKPITLSVADGRKFNVPHPDFLSIDPAGQVVIVFGEKGGFSVIDSELIAAVDVPARNGHRKTRKR